jgi:hypothetical protein
VIIPVMAGLAVILPLLLGGRAGRLATLPLRSTWWIISALLVQVVIVELVAGPEWLLSGMHTATYLIAAAFLARNLRIPGFVLVALGTAARCRPGRGRCGRPA